MGSSENGDWKVGSYSSLVLVGSVYAVLTYTLNVNDQSPVTGVGTFLRKIGRHDIRTEYTKSAPEFYENGTGVVGRT